MFKSPNYTILNTCLYSTMFCTFILFTKLHKNYNINIISYFLDLVKIDEKEHVFSLSWKGKYVPYRRSQKKIFHVNSHHMVTCEFIMSDCCRNILYEQQTTKIRFFCNVWLNKTKENASFLTSNYSCLSFIG